MCELRAYPYALFFWRSVVFCSECAVICTKIRFINQLKRSIESKEYKRPQICFAQSPTRICIRCASAFICGMTTIVSSQLYPRFALRYSVYS